MYTYDKRYKRYIDYENRVKGLREQGKIFQLCLATYVGCSQNTISKIELGITDPKEELLIESSEYFNVSVDYKFIQEVYYYTKRTEAQFLKLFEQLSSKDKNTVRVLAEVLAKSAEEE